MPGATVSTLIIRGIPMLNEQALLKELNLIKSEAENRVKQTKGVTKALNKTEIETLNKIEDLIKKLAAQDLNEPTHWCTSTGEYIRFDQLQDLHLINIFRKCWAARASSPRFAGIVREVIKRWGHMTITSKDAKSAGACNDVHAICRKHFGRTSSTIAQVLIKTPELESLNKEWGDYCYKSVVIALRRVC